MNHNNWKQEVRQEFGASAKEVVELQAAYQDYVERNNRLIEGYKKMKAELTAANRAVEELEKEVERLKEFVKSEKELAVKAIKDLIPLYCTNQQLHDLMFTYDISYEKDKGK